MEEKKFDNIVLVVIYNKALDESVTLNSFLKYKLKNSKLIIHNNGPQGVRFDDLLHERLNNNFDCHVELINSLDNKPLSIIYNEMFIKNNANRFIILDDDTGLSQSFFELLKTSDFDVDLDIPKIISSIDGAIYYPISNGKVVKDSTILDARNVLSIGSGLVINRTLIEKFNRYNLDLFDENYALYGVDYSLFRRMWWVVKQGDEIHVRSSFSLEHSLSRADRNEKYNKVRNRERILDVAITARRYPSLYSYNIFFRRISREILKINFDNVVCMIMTYISGRHPRCYKK
ncbi:glycosyl transferase [Pectobacterium polaris]|uniref:glycosyltransferase family 2 protein n=1 Tax=Pectobacterium polaris TaxID=2042057 RepID=UPI002B246E10|nr:glycosyl transferase [Pectobacterium polaris]